jgi:two-component sensor histidine kinase
VNLPVLNDLSPHAVLQVQRILLEAVTNVLKHARASKLVVTVRVDHGGLAAPGRCQQVGRVPEAFQHELPQLHDGLLTIKAVVASPTASVAARQSIV